MNEERFASRRLLLLLLASASGSSSFGAISPYVRRLLRLYFASDTLFLVTFHLGFSSSVLRFHGGVFLRLGFLLFFSTTSLLLSFECTRQQGVINYFAFLLMNMYSKKKNYTQFFMHFFPSDTTTLRCFWVVSFCLLTVGSY